MARQRTHRGGRHAAGARGFTLLEMAIATAVFGLLASGAILATSAWLGKQSLDGTRKSLDRIESALTLYVVQHGFLPCPYSPAMAAPGTYVGNNCTAVGEQYVGVLPYRDMGLQRSDVMDGWNRYITYAVDATWTDNPTAATPATPFFDGAGNLLTLSGLNTAGATAVLDVRDALSNGAAQFVCKPAGSGVAVRTGVCAAYVLVSHGEDGAGAFLAFGGGTVAVPAGARAENENSDGDEIFAAEAFTAGAGDSHFQHILRFRSPAQILRDTLQ